MSANGVSQPVARTSGERRSIRARWRGWRRSRPFWAGLLVLMSGIILTLIPLGGLRVAFIQGSVLWASMLIGMLILLCGVILWTGGRYSMLTGVLTIIFSLVALITSNIGGFLLGTLLGVVGGSMAIAWVGPKPTPQAPVATTPPATSPGRA